MSNSDAPVDYAEVKRQKAAAVGNSKIELRKRLNSAKSCLKIEYKKFFCSPTFDFEKKRLIGEGGYALQWLLRPHPERLESYHNQQTTVGTVVLVRLKSDVEASPASP